MRSKLQRPSRVTGFANVSKPRSVKGWIKVKSPMMSIFEASSSSNVNCDGLPVVARNRVNNGKQYKARSTCLRTVKFDHVVGPVSSRLLKVWASSKARMMRGWLSSVCLETLSRLLLFTRDGDDCCFLSFKDSTSLWQEAAGEKL